MVVAYDTSNRAFTGEHCTLFESEYHQMGGGEVLSLAFDGDAMTHYSDLDDRIRDHRPDGAVIATSARDTALLCQHLRRKDKTLAPFASAWAYTADFIQHGGPYVEGHFPAVVSQAIRSLDVYRLRKAFEARFGALPNFANTFGY